MITQMPIKIMPLGDSITQGFNSSDLRGYRSALWDVARIAGWSISFEGSLEDDVGSQPRWRHEGHYGWRIDHLCDYISPFLRHYQPEVILLHVGTNDIVQGCRALVAISRLEQLLDCIDLALPDALICVAQITPLGFEALNTRVQRYNELIPDLVQKKATPGRAIQCVDMYNAVSSSAIKDKIHIDDDGYVAMAHMWFQALQSWYPKLALPDSDVSLLTYQDA